MQHAPYACGNADHRHLPAPDPFPVKGRRVRSPSGLPFRPFGPVERFPNFRAHWNCRAEPDTGHGLAEGPRAAHSRGPGGPRAPRPQQAATPPSRVGGGPGRSGLNGRAGRWGGSGAEEKSAPPTSTGPREPRGDAPRGQASRSRPETLPAGASLPQLHFHPSQENPLPTTTPIGPQPATYTCPQGTCTGFSYTSRHTGHVKRPRGSASAAGPASCAPPSRAGACACAAILLPRTAAPQRPRRRPRGGARAVRGARGVAYGTCVGLGAGSAGGPRLLSPRTLGKSVDPDPETGMSGGGFVLQPLLPKI